MRFGFLKFILLAICLNIYLSGLSQGVTDIANTSGLIIDSLKKSGVIIYEDQKKPEILLSPEQAIRILQQKTQSQYWKDIHDPFRLTLNQLIFEASHARFDSAATFLKRYPYDSLSIPWDKFYIWEPLRLKLPLYYMPVFQNHADSLVRAGSNLIKAANDTISQKLLTFQDTARLKPVTGLEDTTIMVVLDTLYEVTSSVSSFPFRYFTHPYQGDSIKVAVNSLLTYLEERDSSVVNFAGVGKDVTKVWMNSKAGKVMRFWLRNEFSDSVTVWIGNPSRNTIGLYLEQGISFRRPVKQGNYSDARVNVMSIDNSKLLNIQKIKVKPQYWKYRSEASIVLNQASLTNWVRGGESSISTALDITGYADYTNKELKLSSNNFARIKYGYLASGDEGIRKNLDLIETNSKLNHKAFGKFDFSAILLFKTQLAPGYNYTKNAHSEDTSILASKFMNPAILTIGLGLDYKPDETTSLNFSPLSYKGTFVTDPAYYHDTYDSTRIDQTNYGISKNRKSLNEPGVSFMITKIFKPTKSISIINRLQLFTNYIHNPQNVDVDWEMIAVVNLNWFTDVRLNTHLIFDDDTRTAEFDKDKNPILRADGTQKKTARVQFKEMLGLSLVFRF
jgi:hypothetical protein